MLRQAATTGLEAIPLCERRCGGASADRVLCESSVAVALLGESVRTESEERVECPSDSRDVPHQNPERTVCEVWRDWLYEDAVFAQLKGFKLPVRRRIVGASNVQPLK